MMKRALLVLALLALTPTWALGSPKPPIGDDGQFETATVVGTVKDRWPWSTTSRLR
jgi:hypothetical protein